MAVQQRETIDFTAHVEASRRWLHAEAYRLCGDWHEAEDLVQLTLYKVYRRWHRLAERDELGPYTRRTLVNTYVSERRRSRWRYESPYAEPPDRPVGGPADDDRATLMAALSTLGPRQRAVVLLRFCGDLSVAQTATVLGCSVGTVTSQTHRALASLRALLDRPMCGPGAAPGRPRAGASP